MAKNGFLSGYAHELEALEKDDLKEGKDGEEDFDALNDETFGAAVDEDWETAHEQLAMIDTNSGFFDTNESNSNLSNQFKDTPKLLAHQLEGDLLNSQSNANALPPSFHRDQHAFHHQSIGPPSSSNSANLTETFMNLNLGATSTPSAARFNQDDPFRSKWFEANLINNSDKSIGSPAANNLHLFQASLNATNPSNTSSIGSRSFRLEDVEASISMMNAVPNPSNIVKPAPGFSPNVIYKNPNLPNLMSNMMSPSAHHLPPHLMPASSLPQPLNVQPSPSNSNSSIGRKVFTLDELENFTAGDRPNQSNTFLSTESLQGSGANNVGRQTPNRYNSDRNQRYNHSNSNSNLSHLGRNQYNSNDNRSSGRQFCPNPLNPLEMIPVDNLTNNRSESYHRNNNNNNNYHYNNNNRQHNHHRNDNDHYQNRNHYHQHHHNNQYNNRNNRHYNQFDQSNANRDEYAGLMTRRNIEWVRKILQMPLEFDDPYVQDYYYVTYQTRKIAAQMLRKEKESGQSRANIPTLIVPDRANSSMNKENSKSNNYTPIDFAGALGKLQVSNVNCPRKLLDFGNKLQRLEQQQESSLDPLSSTETRNEVNKFRQTLLDIERNYAYILQIDHEDKRMAALPEEARAPHIAKRAELCDLLFKGILTTEDQKHLNFSIANIRKGCMLLFRAIQVLRDPKAKAMCITELVNVNNFHYVVMQKDKTLYCLDYGQILVDAIQTIKDCDFDLLLQIAKGLDDPSVIAKFQCGQEIIEMLLNQYEQFENVTPQQKTEWIEFINRVLEDVEEIPHLRNLCTQHLTKLTE